MADHLSPDSRSACEALDRVDPLFRARDLFSLPGNTIYLDGHSLGPATHAALKRLEATARTEWANGLIRSWNDAGWFDLPRTTGRRLARLIGAEDNEVIVADSVSVNLFKLAKAAAALAEARITLVEPGDFPTDQYVTQGLGAWAHLSTSDGINALAKSDRSVLIKSLVNYRTGEVADMAAYERAAAQSGSLIVWDLSHATGVLELRLGDMGTKLATGCTYKYLNGGPGAPAFLYARADLAAVMTSPILGWFGHAQPFAFDARYQPADGVGRFAAGTPGILSLAALDAALTAFDGIAQADIADKARRLGNLVIDRADDLQLEILSPRDARLRGGHVSFRHDEGYAIVQALIARGVIADFRAPDAVRFGVSPLFLRYADVWDAMDHLSDVLRLRAFADPRFRKQAKVT